MPYRKILLAIDNSPQALRAAEKGFALAHQLKAAIGLAYVVNVEKEVVNADLGILPEENEAVLLKEAEETIDQMVRHYKDVRAIDRFTPTGHPGEEIVKLADAWHADLVIVGTHGHTGWERLLKGSVADHVVRHAVVPVMIVPSQAH